MLQKNVHCKKNFKTILPEILTNFDINLFVKDFDKLISLINKCYCYASSN